MNAADVVTSEAWSSRSSRHLTRVECTAALRGQTLGRVGVSQGALPLILPVNYALEGSNIVFRTRQDGLLERACRNTVVAFEVDGYDVDDNTGWSVVAVGVASAMSTSDCLRAVELGLVSAGAHDGAVFVKIVPGTLTGRAVDASAVVASRDAQPR